MSEPRIVAEPYSPAPLARTPSAAGDRATVAGRQARARLTGAPSITLIVLGLLAAFGYWIPELGFAAFLPQLFRQFAGAVPADIFTGGSPVVDGVPDAGAATGIAFVAAIVLGFAGRQGGWARYAVAPAAVVLAVAAIPIVVASLATPLDHLFSVLAGLECVVIGVVVAVRAGRAHVRRGVHPYARRTPELRDWRRSWLVAFLVVLPVPFMIGRALVGTEWRDRAAEISASGSAATFAPLVSLATPLTYVIGASVGIAVWAAVRFIPPWRESRIPPMPLGGRGLPPGTVPAMRLETRRPSLIAPAVVAIVLLGLSIGVVAPLATSSASDTVATTYQSAPGDDREQCTTFVLPESSPEVALRPGSGCVGMASYQGLTRTGVATPSDDHGAASGATTPEGDLIVNDMVGAIYAPVLVVAGSTTGDRIDAVTGYSFVDASIVWRFQCPDASPLSIRLAGVGNDVRDGRMTYAGEPEAVLIGCANGVYRLDPRTGAGF